MYEVQRKRGKHGTKPKTKGSGPQTKDQVLGDSVYRMREDITASSETRIRELYGNDYGKKAQKQKEMDGAGIPVSPRKTEIHGV